MTPVLITPCIGCDGPAGRHCRRCDRQLEISPAPDDRPPRVSLAASERAAEAIAITLGRLLRAEPRISIGPGTRHVAEMIAGRLRYGLPNDPAGEVARHLRAPREVGREVMRSYARALREEARVLWTLDPYRGGHRSRDEVTVRQLEAEAELVERRIA